MATKKSAMKIKRGLKKNLPILQDGQLGYCKDSKELFIGNDGKNDLINAKSEGNGSNNGDITGTVTAEYLKLVAPNSREFKISVTNNGELEVNRVIPAPKEGPYASLKINQIYGGGVIGDEGTAITHGFIELYNDSKDPISLNGLSVQYAKKGKDWEVCELSGMLRGYHSYLIRANRHSEDTSSKVFHRITECDRDWGITMHNKGIKVCIVEGIEPLEVEDPFKAKVENLIDMIGCGDDFIDGAETVPVYGQSKQKSIRRKEGFIDTQDNELDCEIIDYRVADIETVRPRYTGDGAWNEFGEVTEGLDLTAFLKINQVYAGGSDAAISHHFVELYNTHKKLPIQLDGISLYGAHYKDLNWQHVSLNGFTIPPQHSMLIRGAASTGQNKYQINDYDLQCTLKLEKGMKVFIIKSEDPAYLTGIANPFNTNGAFAKVEGYIDGFGCHGNSGNNPATPGKDMIDGYESEPPAGGDPGTIVIGKGGNSKQTSMRRINFQDTDINSEDFEPLRFANYGIDLTLNNKVPRWLAYGPWDENDIFGGEDVAPTGAITINYVDNNGSKIAPPETKTKLELGEHVITALEIPGYTISGESSKTINITAENLVHTVEFVYTRDEVDERKGLIINQYYGGGAAIDTGSVSHAFIELYNSGETTISLEGKSIHYTALVKAGVWEKLNLKGSIPPKHSFLIRCAHTNTGVAVPPSLDISSYQADMEWDMFIVNKGTTIALMNTTDAIPEGVDPQTLGAYIDMIGASDDKGMAVPFFEASPVLDQSKQKSVRRILFKDTNNNNADCEIVDFRYLDKDMTYNKFPRYLAYGEWDENDGVEAPEENNDFEFIPDQPTMAYNTFGEDPKTTRYFRWFTGKDHQGSFKYRLSTSSNFTTVSPTVTVTGEEAMHEVELTGLTANTTYSYQISAGSNWSEEAIFITAGDGDFEFIHVTDSQSTNLIGYEVFNRDLTTALNNSHANFIAHTGDIVEDNGTSDDFWRGFFSTSQSALLNNALVCTPGNNDLTVLEDGTTNLDNYAKHFKFFNRSSITPHSYTFEYGNAFFVCIDYTQKLQEQKAWIKEKLESTNKKWKIVLIHAAPYTSFKEDTFLFAQVFEETNVDLVLCGHKHMYMRSYPMKNDARVNPGEGPVYIMGNSMGVKQNKLDGEQPWMEVRLAPQISCYNNIKVKSNSIEFVANKIVNNVVEAIDSLTLTKNVPVVEEVKAITTSNGEEIITSNNETIVYN